MNRVTSIETKDLVPVYGTIKISGDPIAAISIIAGSILTNSKIQISNVPRSEIVMEFIEIVEKIGANVNWMNSDTIVVDPSNRIDTDLTFIDDSYIKYSIILIPAVLNRNKYCYINTSLRDEAKNYRLLGGKVNYSKGRIEIGIPLDIKKVPKHYDVTNDNRLFALSRYFQTFLFGSLVVINRENEAIYDLISNINWSNTKEVRCNSSQNEFNLYSTLAILTDGEIAIENVHLEESLEYLLIINNIAGSYEVEDKTVKLWRSNKDLKLNYDFSGLNLDCLGYVILILSKILKNPIEIITQSDNNIKKLIKDLNILGCKLDTVNVDYSNQNKQKIILRPSTLSTFRLSAPSVSYTGVMLAAAFSSSSRSHINNLDQFSMITPSFDENLKALGLNFIINKS